MNVKDFIKKVAYVGKTKCIGSPSPTYYSKFDGSYLTLVSMEDNLKFLADREVTEELTNGVGFSPKDNMWYGWSHRAIFGFTIGSECKKGNCNYVASTPEELIEDRYNFFVDISEECAQQHKDECQILEDRSGIRILTTPIKMSVAKDINELVDHLEGGKTLDEETIFKDDFYIIKCGRGAWVAKTLDDAKQMAIDFNEGVS